MKSAQSLKQISSGRVPVFNSEGRKALLRCGINLAVGASAHMR